MWTKRLMWIVWPAFLAAGVMEMLVFAAFDPQDMRWLGQGVELSRTSIYSLAFFAFWAVFIAAGYLTALLSIPSDEVNTYPSLQ
ncbi:MAG: hypothetical protein ITG01_03460 [Comamonas sp.]|nr:hypothetical protein [Comamonas sp.]